mmetsp:Transcript_133943/g.232490  ORF Transcript_133943/g.232490 Transcript_133943/m.232490 type:complete len:257 (-) Transcript_133943:972-1742(-)
MGRALKPVRPVSASAIGSDSGLRGLLSRAGSASGNSAGLHASPTASLSWVCGRLCRCAGVGDLETLNDGSRMPTGCLFPDTATLCGVSTGRDGVVQRSTVETSTAPGFECTSFEALAGLGLCVCAGLGPLCPRFLCRGSASGSHTFEGSRALGAAAMGIAEPKYGPRCGTYRPASSATGSRRSVPTNGLDGLLGEPNPMCRSPGSVTVVCCGDGSRRPRGLKMHSDSQSMACRTSATLPVVHNPHSSCTTKSEKAP